MSRIMYEILPAVILTLLYTSMYSDGITLEPNGSNPVVGYPFEIVCNTEVTISTTVAIKIPDGTVVGSCYPASPPIINASCTDVVGYDATLNELTQTVTLNINNLTSDVNGTWTCTHNSVTGTWPLPAPITDIKEKRVSLNPTSFPETITSQTSISLTVTYECINIPVHFTWFAVDNSSQKNPLDVANTTEKNSSLCKSYPGFDAYTQTYSTSYFKGLDGSYRIGVEVHYSGEVTTLQSIQYFDNYFIFNPTTTTEQQTVTNETTTEEIITDETTTDEIITDETTTDEITADDTTTMQTNDNSKDNMLEKFLVPTISGTIGLIIIITIIVFCVMRRKTYHENATNKKHNKTKNRRIKTRNNSGNPEQVPMPNEHHVDYNRRNNSGNPEKVPMSNEHHVDYNIRNNSGNPEKVPMPNEHHVDYNIRNNSGNPEHAPMPNEPPVDYDRWNDQNSHF